jgi:hypothetical protein
MSEMSSTAPVHLLTTNSRHNAIALVMTIASVTENSDVKTLMSAISRRWHNRLHGLLQKLKIQMCLKKQNPR